MKSVFDLKFKLCSLADFFKFLTFVHFFRNRTFLILDFSILFQVNICEGGTACVDQALDCAATADQDGYAPSGRKRRAANRHTRRI